MKFIGEKVRLKVLRSDHSSQKSEILELEVLLDKISEEEDMDLLIDEEDYASSFSFR